MDTMQKTIAESLSLYVCEVISDGIPLPVIRCAKTCFLDWLGVALQGARTAAAGILLETLDNKNGSGNASLIGTRIRSSVWDAALFNGTIGHALDFDDVLPEMEAHPSTVVFPAILALCESLRLPAQELFSAFVIGVEVGARLGSAMNPDHYAKGWHATGTLGIFAAAAAVGKLLRLSPEQMVCAFGIAATQAAGVQGVFGTMSKPLNAGRAASNGLLAGMLARKGFTAPKNIFEIRGGFPSLFVAERWSKGVNTEKRLQWSVENIVFKHFPSCYCTHAPILAALSLHGKCPLDRIRSIHLSVAPMDLVTDVIGYPNDESEARFSLSYCTAVALVTGRGSLNEFSAAAVNDAQVRKIASLIKVGSQPFLLEFQAMLELELEDGKRLTANKYAGEMSPKVGSISMVEQKFFEGVAPMVGSSRAREIVKKIDHLNSFDDLIEFIQLFVL